MKPVLFSKFLLLTVCMSWFLLSCGDKQQEQKVYKIGFSQCTDETEWRKIMNRNVEVEAMQSGRLDIIKTSSSQKTCQQITDINYLLTQNIDLLLISPNEDDSSLTQVISKAYESGIPVILMDRKTANDKYTTYIGGNNIQIGYDAGLSLCGDLKEGSSIIEFFGLRESTPAKERSKGFHKYVNQNCKSKNFKITTFYCDWTQKCARNTMDAYLDTCKNKPDAVFCHNDDMALGAIESLYAHGDTLKYISGVDGIFGESGGTKAVIDHKLRNTFYYPDGGEIAVQTALKILDGQKVDKQIILNSVKIDTTNAKVLYEQFNLAQSQQQKILLQREKLMMQTDRMTLQQLILVCGAAILIGSIILSLVILRLFVINKRRNIELNEKNTEINAQKEELETQANFLEELNGKLKREKDLTIGSIRSAQIIQNALLPDEDEIKQSFNCFIMYMPKDIVSGDFYWYHKAIKDNTEINIVCVVDCTGHGVPGAFMSLIGINLLDQIVRQQLIFSPAKILTELNQLVRKMLHQSDVGNDDGMETIICRIDKTADKEYTVIYEGAKFPLYRHVKQTDEIITYKTTRKGIGGKLRNRESSLTFEDKQFKAEKGDRLYLTSDGIGDQNDESRKRYTSSQLVKALEESINLDCELQKKYIKDDLISFKGSCEQRDDITVIGLELI